MSTLFMDVEVKREAKKRDPLLDHRAVRKYREIVHLQANHIQREEIAFVVEDSDRGERIWEAVLVEWMLHGYNPKNVVGMLNLYRAQAPEWNGFL